MIWIRLVWKICFGNPFKYLRQLNAGISADTIIGHYQFTSIRQTFLQIIFLMYFIFLILYNGFLCYKVFIEHKDLLVCIVLWIIDLWFMMILINFVLLMDDYLIADNYQDNNKFKSRDT